MYFHKVKWLRDWIEMAEGLLQTQFNKFYKKPVETPATKVILSSVALHRIINIIVDFEFSI